MIRLKEGDMVRVVERAQTAADAKSGLYYRHYQGLTGAIFKLYGSGESAQAALDVDLESLSPDIAQRHLETRDRMASSFQGDTKRTAGRGEPEAFRLRYVILIAVADLKRRAAPAGDRALAGAHSCSVTPR